MQESPSNSSHEDVYKSEKNDLKIVHAGEVDINQVQGFDAPAPSKMTRRAQVLALAICTGGFLFGYDIGKCTATTLFTSEGIRLTSKHALQV